VRTATRKSVVGSPRPKPAAPPVAVESPKKATGGTYADQMSSSPAKPSSPKKRPTKPIYTIHSGVAPKILQRPRGGDTSSQTSADSGVTYADQMQAVQSKVQSSHAPVPVGGPNVYISSTPKMSADPIPPHEEQAPYDP
jgi:hypothetical protein